jgi:hypothetical protein
MTIERFILSTLVNLPDVLPFNLRFATNNLKAIAFRFLQDLGINSKI